MKKLILASAALVAAGCSSSQPQRSTQTYPPQNSELQREATFVGPRGPVGPAGARGAQGATGETGAAGYAMAGERGPDGAVGAMGEQGRRGAQGATGEVMVGQAGAVGPAGNTGAQGSVGSTGARGASTAGYAGAAGTTGTAGAQGPTGQAGVQGPTLVGPTGPAGRSGAIGAQGEAGQIGARGSTTAGVGGAIGATGATGPRGQAGPTGPPGSVGVIEHWVSYREFWFDTNMSAITAPEADQVAEIAAYIKENPSLQLGIDSSFKINNADTSSMELATRRSNTVRDALIAAGVPAKRISEGEFGDADLRRDGRVEILIKSNQIAQAPSDASASQPVVADWSSYRDFWFDPAKTDIHPADASRVADIAALVKQNPSLQLGIDSSIKSHSTDPRSMELATRRGDAVRDALIAAGVPASNIKNGTFGNVDFRREGRVEVLVPADGPTMAKHSPSGAGTNWKTYDDFAFSTDKSVIHDADALKVTRIAAYMKANPSYQLGIDGSTNPRATEWSDRDLCNRRVEAIRDALTTAGVPAGRINDGMMGDVKLRRADRVEILMLNRSDQLTQVNTSTIGENWSSYRDFWFDLAKADIHPADASRVTDIAALAMQNPSLQLGIDSSIDAAGDDQRKEDLATRRGNTVRDALIAAGVPANRISEGVFGDADLRRDGRVEVLVKVDQVAQAN